MRTICAIVKRNLKAFFRNKIGIISSLIMPAILVILFGGMMKSSDTGISSPMNYLISGVLLMLVFQGAMSNSTSVMSDIASGFMKEIIVAPVPRSAIALGNILSSAVIGVMQGSLVLILGLFMGFQANIKMLAPMLVLMFLTGIVSAAGALLLSLTVKSQTNFQFFSMFVTMPMMYLSGAYVPVTTLPRVLMPFVYINPLTYLTAAFRYVTLGMWGMNRTYLVSQGVAFPIGSITIMPGASWILVLLIGNLVFWLCVRKFAKVDLSSLKPMMS